MNVQTLQWRNLRGKQFHQSITTLVAEAIQREQQNGHRLKICVGSDSQVYGNDIYYATAVMVVRQGKGAFAFIHKEKCIETISIKERMLNEINRSVAIAYNICPILEQFNVPLEVHADINTDPSFKSNTALKEAMGYILGMGYQFVAKPYAFASSSCADMVV